MNLNTSKGFVCIQNYQIIPLPPGIIIKYVSLLSIDILNTSEGFGMYTKSPNYPSWAKNYYNGNGDLNS